LPYSVGWLIENRVIEAAVRGVMTEYELRTLMEDISRLAFQGTQPTYLIVDSLDLRRTSFGVDTLKQVSGIRCGHELIVVVTTNLLQMTLARSAALIFGMRIVVTSTVGEAKLTISQHDPSIQFP
jgi:hypothetical protein